MHYANTDLALDLALHHLTLPLPTSLSSFGPRDIPDNPTRSYQSVSLAMRISMLVRRESRVSFRAIQGEIRETHTFEPVFLTSLTILFNIQYLDRSSSQSTEILQRPTRIAPHSQTHTTWWSVPCCQEYSQTQLKLPFNRNQKLTLMIKMELENVTDVVPKDDYEFQMNVSQHQIEEQV
jgi:hypothetical protein